ncbi:MAG: hypothetical protein AAGA03_11735 [Planctomycetota bacterium]
MWTRIFSHRAPFANQRQAPRDARLRKLVLAGTAGVSLANLVTGIQPAIAEDKYDPATGIVYRERYQTVEEPVVQTRMVQREQTTLVPRTVTETRPSVETHYTPITYHVWEPKLEGRFNPFRQPTWVYKHRPVTTWTARNVTVDRTATSTQWVAKTETVSVPQQTMSIARRQVKVLEPVAQQSPQTQIANRLRPLPRTNTAAGTESITSRIAARSVGRGEGQGPQPATELYPSSSLMAPVVTAPAIIATAPAPILMR